MTRSLSFLHTSPVHIQTFNTLIAELAPDIAVRHVVDESLQSEASQSDVIVLAQASMARAVEFCPGLALPVLTSPRSGLLAAIQAYREHEVAKAL